MRVGPILAALLLPAAARASAEKPYDPHPPPTLYWMLAQLVPSPELGFGGAAPAAGMRWQLTPLLYSWGIYRKLSPWRTFVVEPLTRVSGSIELFVSPEYLDGSLVRGSAAMKTDEWIVRAGVHATFPILGRGEKVAFTIGAGACFGGESSAEIEAGFSILYGALGIFVTYAPRLSLAPATAMLRFRWF